MAGIPNASRLILGGLILAAAVLAGCEDIAYEMREHPDVVRMVGKREVTIMERRF